MTTPPDPLAAALRAALEEEDHADDDAILERAIDGAMNSLETSAHLEARAPARLSRSNVKLLRYALPVAAAFAASVAMASAYFVTHSYSTSTTDQTLGKSASEPHPSGPSTAESNAHERSATEEKTISIDELPSVDAPTLAPKAIIREPSAIRHDAPSAETTSAADLFRQANVERRAGNVANAIQLYRSLQSRYPNAAESHASRVSLGRLLLDRQSDPKGALAEFDAYLQVSGDETLAEEARVGRALAFQRLGDRNEERRAWLELLEHHPDSLQVARAKQRLEALETPRTP